MKNFYPLIAFVLVSVPFYGQIVNIPDANFKARLVNNQSATIDPTPVVYFYSVDSNHDGEIQVSEANAITGLDISTPTNSTTGDILSLEGIQYFPNLKVLNCSGNNLVNLDVTSLSQLYDLDCSYDHLQTLNIVGLSNLVKLQFNKNTLSNINTTGLSSLKIMFGIYNNLTQMDVSALPALENLQVDFNQITNFAFGNQSAIKVIACSNNLLTYLDLQSVPNLETLWASNNAITSLNLNGLNYLSTLTVDSNALTTLDASQAPVLNFIQCSYNPGLTSINVRNNYISYGDPDLLYFPFHFDFLPLLTSICLDSGEQNYLVNALYNSNPNVSFFTGPNCDIPLFITPNAVTNFEDATAFKIYPNPVNTMLQLEVATVVSVQSVQIYTTLGQLVRSLPVLNPSSKSSFDVSDLTAGTYFITVLSNRGKSTQKFIKI